MKAFGYIRVSTKDQNDRNTPENQREAIQKFCLENQLELVGYYEDVVSGTEMTRTQLQALKTALAVSTKVNPVAVVTWSIDRLGRSKPSEVLSLVAELNKLTFNNLYFIHDPIDQSMLEEEDYELMLFSKSYVARKWYKINRANQKAGIMRRKKELGRWGRMKKPFNKNRYLELKEMGLSLTAIAKVMGMSPPTLRKRLRENELYEPQLFRGVRKAPSKTDTFGHGQE